MKHSDGSEDNNFSVSPLRCDNCGATCYTMDAFDAHTTNRCKEIKNRQIDSARQLIVSIWGNDFMKFPEDEK